MQTLQQWPPMKSMPFISAGLLPAAQFLLHTITIMYRGTATTVMTDGKPPHVDVFFWSLYTIISGGSIAARHTPVQRTHRESGKHPTPRHADPNKALCIPLKNNVFNENKARILFCEQNAR